MRNFNNTSLTLGDKFKNVRWNSTILTAKMYTKVTENFLEVNI